MPHRTILVTIPLSIPVSRAARFEFLHCLIYSTQYASCRKLCPTSTSQHLFVFEIVELHILPFENVFGIFAVKNHSVLCLSEAIGCVHYQPMYRPLISVLLGCNSESTV